MNHLTIRATINGETRDVPCHELHPGKRADSDHLVGLYQKRPGQKVWPQVLTFWAQPDGSWKLGTATTILNRSGYRLIGWADQATGNVSNHNSAGGIPTAKTLV